MNDNNIMLQKARKDDCRDLWAWRNHQEVLRWSFHPERVKYITHWRWFKQKIRDRNTIIYIARNGKREKIGQVRFEAKENKKVYININLNPDFFGRSLGNKVIKMATELFMKERVWVKKVIAEIMDGNVVSKKAFEKAGYVFLYNTWKQDEPIAVYEMVK